MDGWIRVGEICVDLCPNAFIIPFLIFFGEVANDNSEVKYQLKFDWHIEKKNMYLCQSLVGMVPHYIQTIVICTRVNGSK